MSFEKDFNSTNILAGTAFAASIAGGLIGEIAQAMRDGRAARDQQDRQNVSAGDSALGLRMVERHLDYGARGALRALDEAKRALDGEAPRLSLGKDTNGVYMALYKSLYVFSFGEIQDLREWNHALYAGIAHSSGHRRLGAADLAYLRVQWVLPVQQKLKAIIAAMTKRHSAFADGLRPLARTHGDVVFAWLAQAGAMRKNTVEKLQQLHDSLEAVMFSEIVDRRTARELGE